MKKLFFPALVLGMSMSAFAQSDSEPCCGVISVDAATKLVIARDKTTGMLYQFKADAMDIRSINTNDQINVSGGMITSVSGANRTYANVRISYGEPCCSVISFQPDPATPCCTVITYGTSGSSASRIIVPKQIASTLKVGDPVYAEPAGRPSTGMAVIYSGNAAYGYPVVGATGNAVSNAEGDQEPCCSVVGIDKAGNNVLARDNTSGKLYQFRADAMDINSIKNNDVVNVVSGKITSINGAGRMYPNVRVSYGSPCCTVVSIQPDPSEPCCQIISYIAKGTNALYNFKAPKEVSNNLKVGDPVYAEPAGRPASMKVGSVASSVPGLAVVYAHDATTGGPSAYGYPIGSSNASTASNSNEIWKMTPNKLRGVTGRFVFSNLPRDAEWTLNIYQEPENKHISTFYHTGSSDHAVLGEGNYTIHLLYTPLQGIPVKKGHDTELKFGILDVASGGAWELYRNDKHMLTRYNPGKVALSPGSYKLKLGGTEYTVVIKEGKTEEY